MVAVGSTCPWTPRQPRGRQPGGRNTCVIQDMKLHLHICLLQRLTCPQYPSASHPTASAMGPVTWKGACRGTCTLHVPLYAPFQCSVHERYYRHRANPCTMFIHSPAFGSVGHGYGRTHCLQSRLAKEHLHVGGMVQPQCARAVANTRPRKALIHMHAPSPAPPW